MIVARRLARLAGFVLLQIVLVVVLLEAVARIFDPFGISYFSEVARYGDTLVLEEPIGYRNRPGLDGQFSGVPVRINRLGLRDREIEGKAPGEYRILAMGDSVPFGIGVRYEDSYPHQLEVLLNERHASRHFRTLNMGVPSYNTEQELIQLKTLGLSLQPDAVTLFFSSNDIEPKLWSRNKLNHWYAYLVQRSYAGSLVTLVLQKAFAQIVGGNSRSQDPNARDTSRVALDQYRLDSPRWQAIDRSLTEIHAILKARHVPFVLYSALEQPYIIEMLEGMARREGILYVNLQQRKDDPRWAGLDKRRLRNSVVDGHPSPLGNTVLATLMAESLERHKALGRR
jgi:lysophospholipase L1-like esterase